jgi:hypothetical protein
MQRGFDWSSYEKTAPGVIAALSQVKLLMNPAWKNR